MRRGDFGIAYRPTPRNRRKPWALQIVRPDGRNILAGRYETKEQAQEAIRRLADD